MSSTPPHGWSLSTDALERLLDALGPDRDVASRQYEAFRHRLIQFFDWRGALTPDALADETLDRVARRLVAGEPVDNMGGYLRGVARHVLQEWHKRSLRERSALEAMARVPATVAAPD